jgi:hypothetical protein
VDPQPASCGCGRRWTSRRSAGEHVQDGAAVNLASAVGLLVDAGAREPVSTGGANRRCSGSLDSRLRPVPASKSPLPTRRSGSSTLEKPGKCPRVCSERLTPNPRARSLFSRSPIQQQGQSAFFLHSSSLIRPPVVSASIRDAHFSNLSLARLGKARHRSNILASRLSLAIVMTTLREDFRVHHLDLFRVIALSRCESSYVDLELAMVNATREADDDQSSFILGLWARRIFAAACRAECLPPTGC